jgi:predicted RNase H-like nuclease
VTVFVGIDGIPKGWAAVYLSDDGRHRFAHADRIAKLLDVRYQRAMIDIPIGLPEHGYRHCDIEAHKLVRERVFLGSRHGVWKFATLDEANANYWKTEGKGRGISMQLFGIRDKLQEANEKPLPPRVFEAHPELFFWRIAGRVLDSKKIEAGRNQRFAILKDRGLDITHWLGQRRGTGIGRDDLIDACACALVARDGTHTVPDNITDEPKIWY